MKATGKSHHKNSIFRRYFAITSLIVAGALIMLGLVMIIFTASQWWNEKTEALSANATIIVNSIKDLDIHTNLEDPENIEHFAETLEIVSQATQSDFFVINNEGKLVACKEMNEESGFKPCDYHANIEITEDFLKRAKAGGFMDYVGNDEFGLGNFVVAVPIVIGEDTVGTVFGVEDAIAGLLPYILSILKTFFYSWIVALFISFLITYFLTRGITRPLMEMEEVTKHFAKGEFQHRANENYKRGYLSEFAKALNTMADELSIEEEAQRSFIANVSHELKTPMTTISGFIDGILDGTIPPEKQKEYLTVVSKEIRRLSRIVVSMLNLSKIEAGEVNITPIRYDISAQIFETLLPFEQIIDSKQIRVKGFEDLEPMIVNADRDLIQQVIYNLFDNAVKFTPEGGEIIVKTERTDTRTIVHIRNTGTVREEELSRIFERFYKVDKSRSYDIKGVGLGLYIVKTIVNMHDGEIKATSIDGQYVEFSFDLPN